MLQVAERSFEEETFGRDDLRLFEALAAHATVALSKAHAIERLKQVAEERRLEAMHDPLTALPNRRAFSEAMQEAIARGEGGAVLLLDLDDFKDVNDTLGHTRRRRAAPGHGHAPGERDRRHGGSARRRRVRRTPAGSLRRRPRRRWRIGSAVRSRSRS